jgi:hypothetical protein
MIPPLGILRRGSLSARLLSAVLASLLVIGCGDPAPAPQAAQQPAETAKPVPSVTPSPPFILSITGDYAYHPELEPFPIETVEQTHLIIQGTVVNILPARWTTPDGTRPVDPSRAVESREATIITPVVVQLTGPPIVDRRPPDLPIDVSSGEVVIAALGGQVGLDSIRTDDWSQLFEVGDVVLVGLTSVSPDRAAGLIPTERGPAWSVAFKFDVTTDGRAQAPGQLGYRSAPLNELVTQYQNAAAQLPPVNPIPIVLPTPPASVPTFVLPETPTP